MPFLTERETRPGWFALALAAATLAGGCGYSIRPPFDHQIRTVYVPVFRSQSFRKDMNLMITERVQKEIARRTPYRIVNSEEAADAILEGYVTYVDKSVSVENPNNLPRHLNSLVTMEVRFYRKGDEEGKKASPVVVSETAPFYPELGETSMLGFQKSIDKLAMQIVGMMEKPWQ